MALLGRGRAAGGRLCGRSRRGARRFGSLPGARVRVAGCLDRGPLLDVRGQAARRDCVSSTTLGGSLTSSAISQLPLARNYVSVASLFAGTIPDAAGFTVYGATGLENQLRNRRAQHHGNPVRRPGKAAEHRVRPGGRGPHGRLRSRVRAGPRREHQRHHEVRRQRVPRRRLRVLRQLVPRRRRPARRRPERRRDLRNRQFRGASTRASGLGGYVSEGPAVVLRGIRPGSERPGHRPSREPHVSTRRSSDRAT